MRFDVTFAETERFAVAATAAQPFPVDLGSITKVGTADAYTGEYEVTPKVYDETELSTENKMMAKNVRVRKVPQYEVGNTSGGKTLIIGDEYYG